MKNFIVFYVLFISNLFPILISTNVTNITTTTTTLAPRKSSTKKVTTTRKTTKAPKTESPWSCTRQNFASMVEFGTPSCNGVFITSDWILTAASCLVLLSVMDSVRAFSEKTRDSFHLSVIRIEFYKNRRSGPYVGLFQVEKPFDDAKLPKLAPSEDFSYSCRQAIIVADSIESFNCYIAKDMNDNKCSCEKPVICSGTEKVNDKYIKDSCAGLAGSPVFCSGTLIAINDLKVEFRCRAVGQCQRHIVVGDFESFIEEITGTAFAFTATPPPIKPIIPVNKCTIENRSDSFLIILAAILSLCRAL